MGQLYIPGEKKIEGPWLIGIHELEELDEIFGYIETKVNDSINLNIKESAKIAFKEMTSFYQTLEAAIASKEKYYSEKKVKRVILISSDEKRLIDTSIKGILKDPKLQDFKPKELQLDMGDYSNNHFSLNIERRFNDRITYKVNCFDSDCQEEIKYKIDNWLDKYQPNKPKQIWAEWGSLFIMMAIICALFSAPLIVTNELPDFKTIYKNDINQIIKSGVNKENETKAIELLLKYGIDYKPDDVKEVKKINKTAIQFFSISIFILIISIFRPKTTIGIGKHKSLLKFYNIYTYFVLITLPGIFVIPPIIGWIKNVTGL